MSRLIYFFSPMSDFVELRAAHAHPHVRRLHVFARVYALAVPEAAYRRRVVWPDSAAIALTGIFWTAIRLI